MSTALLLPFQTLWLMDSVQCLWLARYGVRNASETVGPALLTLRRGGGEGVASLLFLLQGMLMMLFWKRCPLSHLATSQPPPHTPTHTHTHTLTHTYLQYTHTRYTHLYRTPTHYTHLHHMQIHTLSHCIPSAPSLSPLPHIHYLCSAVLRLLIHF